MEKLTGRIYGLIGGKVAITAEGMNKFFYCKQSDFPEEKITHGAMVEFSFDRNDPEPFIARNITFPAINTITGKITFGHVTYGLEEIFIQVTVAVTLGEQIRQGKRVTLKANGTEVTTDNGLVTDSRGEAKINVILLSETQICEFTAELIDDNGHKVTIVEFWNNDAPKAGYITVDTLGVDNNGMHSYTANVLDKKDGLGVQSPFRITSGKELEIVVNGSDPEVTKNQVFQPDEQGYANVQIKLTGSDTSAEILFSLVNDVGKKFKLKITNPEPVPDVYAIEESSSVKATISGIDRYLDVTITAKKNGHREAGIPVYIKLPWITTAPKKTDTHGAVKFSPIIVPEAFILTATEITIIAGSGVEEAIVTQKNIALPPIPPSPPPTPKDDYKIIGIATEGSINASGGREVKVIVTASKNGSCQANIPVRMTFGDWGMRSPIMTNGSGEAVFHNLLIPDEYTAETFSVSVFVGDGAEISQIKDGIPVPKRSNQDSKFVSFDYAVSHPTNPHSRLPHWFPAFLRGSSTDLTITAVVVDHKNNPIQGQNIQITAKGLGIDTVPTNPNGRAEQVFTDCHGLNETIIQAQISGTAILSEKITVNLGKKDHAGNDHHDGGNKKIIWLIIATVFIIALGITQCNETWRVESYNSRPPQISSSTFYTEKQAPRVLTSTYIVTTYYGSPIDIIIIDGTGSEDVRWSGFNERTMNEKKVPRGTTLVVRDAKTAEELARKEINAPIVTVTIGEPTKEE